MTKANIHPFSVEHAADGLYYLHTNRAPNKNSVAFDANRHRDGFSADIQARAFAKEFYAATDEDFAPHSGAR